jgi:Arc/MetJ-type ribon-helix-helix transcriptional regulator
MKPENTGVNVGSKIPFSVKKLLLLAVSRGRYMNMSDFVRGAIKEKLQREGFLAINTGKIRDDKEP